MNDLKPTPVVRKGVNLPITPAVVAWVDLLGYGAMIAAGKFNPLREEAIEANERLARFHALVATKSARYFPTLVMNDGAVAYRDLSLRSSSITYDFLQRSWDLFAAIQNDELMAGHPGARMVIAAGFRMRSKRGQLDRTVGHLRSLLTRLESGKISAEQAIREAARIRPSFDVVPELQANFAFTRAYVADQSGQKGGLKGPQCFVDLSLFTNSLPNWIQADDPIRWRHERLGLQIDFVPVHALIPTKHPTGIRDGLQVAQHLGGDADFLRALRRLANAHHPKKG
jgi:hypothetical protein